MGLCASAAQGRGLRTPLTVNPMPNAEIVMRQLPAWFDHYNRLHPHKALGYRSPREFIADRSIAEDVSGL